MKNFLKRIFKIKGTPVIEKSKSRIGVNKFQTQKFLYSTFLLANREDLKGNPERFSILRKEMHDLLRVIDESNSGIKYSKETIERVVAMFEVYKEYYLNLCKELDAKELEEENDNLDPLLNFYFSIKKIYIDELIER